MSFIFIATVSHLETYQSKDSGRQNTCRAGKPLYNHVFYQQNQALIHPRSTKSPNVLAVTVQC